MIIVKVWAGLGNQMFQYALYKSLQQRGLEAKLDKSYFDTMNAHYGYELEKIFSIKPIYATALECQRLANTKMDIFNRFFRKYIYQKHTHVVPAVQEAICYNPDIFEYRNVYLQGYWQSEKYFKHIRQSILEDFTFKIDLDLQNRKVISDMKKMNSVSLHVRRGDYINTKLRTNHNDLSLGGVCTIEYYKNAIQYMKKKLKEPVFYIFSDDIDWCKNNLDLKDAIFVDWNTGESSYRDLQLMSQCKNNIIANSTFSWWGAWLNENESKIVAAPDKWYANGHTGDIISDSWIKISTR